MKRYRLIRRTSLVSVWLSVFAVASASAFIFSAAFAAQPLGGHITHCEGRVEVQYPGGKASLCKPNNTIDYYQEVTTYDLALVEISLPSAILNTFRSEPSAVLFDKTSGVSLVKLLRGSLEARVLPPNSTTFLTDNSVLKILGTLFDVSYTTGVVRPDYSGCAEYTDVIVREGVVAVDNPANPTVVVDVPAGYETTIPCKQPPLFPGPIGITGAPAPGDAAFSGLVAGVGGSAEHAGLGLPSPNLTAPVPVPALVQ